MGAPTPTHLVRCLGRPTCRAVDSSWKTTAISPGLPGSASVAENLISDAVTGCRGSVTSIDVRRVADLVGTPGVAVAVASKGAISDAIRIEHSTVTVTPESALTNTRGAEGIAVAIAAERRVTYAIGAPDVAVAITAKVGLRLCGERAKCKCHGKKRFLKHIVFLTKWTAVCEVMREKNQGQGNFSLS